MAEVNVTPKLRFPEFEVDWQEKKLANISELITKGTTPQAFSESGINYVKIECLNGINIIKDRCLFISEQTHLNELKRSILKNDDILFAIAGATVGKIGIVTEDILPANTNQALAIIRLKNKQLNTFLIPILSSRRMKKYIFQSMSVGAQPNLSLKQINDFSFAAPIQTAEQQKIASFLTAIDERIQLLQKKKAKLEEYKKGVMQKLFSQQIRFKDENGNDYPDWEEKQLGNLTTISKGKQLNKSELTEEGEYPCQNGGIDPSGYTNEYNTDENTITISEGGNSCGYVNFMKSKFWCGGHCYALINLKDSLNLSFLFQSLKFNQHNLMRLRVGSGLPNIQKGDVTKFKIALPSKKRLAS